MNLPVDDQLIVAKIQQEANFSSAHLLHHPMKVKNQI